MTGTCFGFLVRSQEPLAYLRDGGAAAVLDVGLDSGDGPGPQARLVAEWKPTADRPALDGRLYALAHGYRLQVAGDWFGIDPARPRVGLPPAAEPVRREERLWGVPAALCFIARGDLPLHAAAVEVGGAALLLAAPSRFGKTTLAAAFAAVGHRLLSEDLCCLRAGSPFELLPGPAMLRLRHDVATAVGVDPAWVVAEDEDRLHVALPSAERGSGAPVPVGGVVLLRDTESGIRLTRAEPEAVLADLWALSFHLPDRDERVRCFEGVVALAASVPVWNLERPLRFDALPAAIEHLIGHA